MDTTKRAALDIEANKHTIEGFPMGPQQRNAWHKIGMGQATNIIATAKLLTPICTVELKEILTRLVENEPQFLVSFDAFDGMTLPMQVINSRKPTISYNEFHVENNVDFYIQKENMRMEMLELGKNNQPVLAVTTIVNYPSSSVIVLMVAVAAFLMDESSLLLFLDRIVREGEGTVSTGDLSGAGSDSTITYQHFSEWANEAITGKQGVAASQYWCESEFQQASHLLDVSSISISNNQRECVEREISKNLFDAVSLVDLSPEAVMLAAWAHVAGQLMGYDPASVVISRLAPCRLFGAFSKVIGPFAGYMPIIIERNPEIKIHQWIKNIIQRCIVHEENAALLDEKNHNNLVSCDVSFAWISGPTASSLFSSITIQPSIGYTRLCAIIEPLIHGYRLRVMVRDPWGKNIAERLIDALLASLQVISCDIHSSLAIIPLIGDKEKTTLLNWNVSFHRHYELDSSIPAAFQRIASTRPNAIAVHDQSGEYSFGELKKQSDDLAIRLQIAGIKRGAAVAVYTEKTHEAIVGLLGVMQAGAVYTPINSDFPSSRISQMRQNGNIKWAVSDTENFEKASKIFNSVLNIKAVGAQRQITGLNNCNKPRPNDAAYMIFTSGSTGQPKGVVVEHGSALNLWAALSEVIYYDVVAPFRITVNAPLSFDASIKQILLLLSGYTLYLVPSDIRADPERLLIFLAEKNIDVLDCTPSLFRLLINAGLNNTFPGLPGRILLGGEAIDPKLWKMVSTWERTKVFNVYGPTETTVDATVTRVKKDMDLNIGSPLPNVYTYVVDGVGRLKTMGSIGELWIGGKGVSRGYVNNKQLTSERFIVDPYADSINSNARLYRSGDQVRWRSDGKLEFEGRIDDQVKIHGYRIELEDIRNTLLEHPAIDKAAVLLDTAEDGEKTIVSFVTPFPVSQLCTDWLEIDLPTGHRIASFNQNETNYVYNEIFHDLCYVRNGIVLPPDAIVLDVGANVGLFSLFIAAQVPEASIYAFEPLAPIRERLKENLRRYAQQHAHVFNCGLSDSERDETFSYYPNYSILSGQANFADTVGEHEVILRYLGNQSCAGEKHSSLLLDNIEEILVDRFIVENHTCHVRRLGDILKELSLTRVDLLKIDVQRAELDVLRGLGDEDWDKIAQIVLEVHDKKDSPTAGRVAEITALLQDKGFKVDVHQDFLLDGTDRYNCYAKRVAYSDTFTTCVNFTVSDAITTTNSNFLALEISARKFIEARLPSYMVPKHIIVMDQIPLTNEGKIDRKVLHAQLKTSTLKQQIIENPINNIEAELVNIWSIVLKHQTISVVDNFFQIGGDSFRLIQMQAIARKRGYNFTLRDLFRYPTVRELALMLDASFAGKNHANDIKYSHWLVRTEKKNSRIRIFFFPPIGGNAGVFSEWKHYLPDDVESIAIQFPGRQERMNEPFVIDFRAAVEMITNSIGELLDRPYILVGASLGALFSFETARLLRMKNYSSPEHIIAISSRAPQPNLQYSRFHQMKDDELINTLCDYDALPIEIINNKEFCEIALKIMRSDSMLSDSYMYQHDNPFDCPISAIVGNSDRVMSHDQAAAWGQHTTSNFQLHVLSGGHNLVVSSFAEILTILNFMLERYMTKAI